MQLRAFPFEKSDDHRIDFHQYLRMRKQYFVNDLKWNLPTEGDFETDQFDNPTAHYTVVTRNGSVLGGARVSPTDTEFSGHSYLLKDVKLGRIRSIPDWVYPNVRESPQYWEGTRLILSTALTSPQDRLKCLSLIMLGLSSTIKARGGEYLLTLSPKPLAKLVSQLGYRPVQIGHSYKCEDDGREYAAFQTKVNGADVRHH